MIAREASSRLTARNLATDRSWGLPKLTGFLISDAPRKASAV